MVFDNTCAKEGGICYVLNCLLVNCGTAEHNIPIMEVTFGTAPNSVCYIYIYIYGDIYELDRITFNS